MCTFMHTRSPHLTTSPAHTHAYVIYRKHLDVDEITIDASASWTPVDKPQDMKDEEGKHTYENRDHIVHFLKFHFKALVTWKV